MQDGCTIQHEGMTLYLYTYCWLRKDQISLPNGSIRLQESTLLHWNWPFINALRYKSNAGYNIRVVGGALRYSNYILGDMDITQACTVFTTV